MSKGELLIYQGKDGVTQVSVHLQDETLWLNQGQMAELFQTTKQNIGQHVKNILADGELDAEGTVKDFFTVAREGRRNVKRLVEHYNLDMIISVGYRVNSHVGVHFRRWATERLREYIIKGFVLDDARLKQARDGYFDELLGRTWVPAGRSGTSAAARKCSTARCVTSMPPASTTTLRWISHASSSRTCRTSSIGPFTGTQPPKW